MVDPDIMNTMLSTSSHHPPPPPPPPLTWRFYNHALIPAVLPHEKPDVNELKGLLKNNKKAWFARWTSNFDCDFETPWYYVIRETPIDIDKIPSRKRYVFNYGLKNFIIKKIEFNTENIKKLYEVYIKAAKRYKAFKAVPEPAFTKNMLNSPDVCYGAFYKDNEQLCGYVTIKEKNSIASLNLIKFDEEYYKFRVSYALLFTVVNIYLGEKKYKYIHNGEREIRHITETQEFMVNRLGFRRAYTNLHIKYKLLFGLLVKICYPFRETINKLPGVFFHDVYSVLSQEQIRRETNKIFNRESLNNNV